MRSYPQGVEIGLQLSVVGYQLSAAKSASGGWAVGRRQLSGGADCHRWSFKGHGTREYNHITI
jgi:hypothetical protein